MKFFLRIHAGTWVHKFPKGTTLKVVIRNRRIYIGKKLITLRRSKNKRFRGWFTFSYNKVTYYIIFTSRGVKIVKLKGKKVVISRVVSRPKIKIHIHHPTRPHPRRRKNFLLITIHAFFYKNKLYKNIEAEKPRKFKNILRIY